VLANSGAPREFHLHVPSPRWGRYLRVAIAVAARSKRPDETMQLGHQRMCTVNRRDQHGVYHGKGKGKVGRRGAQLRLTVQKQTANNLPCLD